MKLKIAIVVHGRFHAFDLARELINLGHDVTLLTNYPKSVAEKFGIPRKCVRSFLLHGVLSRIIAKAYSIIKIANCEAFLHSYFSQCASRILLEDEYDIIHIFSGVAEKICQALSNRKATITIVRGSAHIQAQHQLLKEEEKRAGVSIDKPSFWMLEREQREYKLADGIVVLSTFAKQSFLDRRFYSEQLLFLPLGSQLKKFHPSKKIIEARQHRIITEKKLNVLMIGTFSFRKGIIDFITIASNSNLSYNFRFVGSIPNESKHLIDKASKYIELIPKQPQFKLLKHYSWADIFIFPTIEDGFAMVLAQAQAAGLPIITTTNCSSFDLIVENQTGWIVPIRNPEAFVERLQWCDQHREELAQMVWKIYQDFQPRDWSDVARDFVQIHQDLKSKNLASTSYE